MFRRSIRLLVFNRCCCPSPPPPPSHRYCVSGVTCNTLDHSTPTPQVLSAGLGQRRYGPHVPVNLLGFIVVACLWYAVLSFIERSRSFPQAPDEPPPPREQPGRAIEEGAVEKAAAAEEGEFMLRPLLRAEAQSAANRQDRT